MSNQKQPYIGHTQHTHFPTCGNNAREATAQSATAGWPIHLGAISRSDRGFPYLCSSVSHITFARGPSLASKNNHGSSHHRSCIYIYIYVCICICIYIHTHTHTHTQCPYDDCLFSWRYNPLGLYFHSPVAGFSLLVFEVSWSHTTTRHSR
jgi:hypothetical protein